MNYLSVSTQLFSHSSYLEFLFSQIQPELITLDNKILGDVDTESLKKSIDDKPKYIKKADIELTHRRKRKYAKIPKAKQNIQSELNLRLLREADQRRKRDQSDPVEKTESETVLSDDPLSRFTKKKKTAYGDGNRE